MRKLFTKLMLLMLLMVVGGLSPAWGSDTTTTFDFEDGNAVFTGDSRITVAIKDDSTLNSKVVGFTCASNAQNGYSFAHYDFSSLVAKASVVTLEFDYYNTNGGRAILSIGDASVRGDTGNSSKTTYSGNGALFRIGSDKNNAYINSTSLKLDDYCNKWLHVKVVTDVVNKKVSYIVKEGETTLKEESDIDYYNSEALSCSQIDLFGFINNSHCAMIDNLSITATVDDSAVYADYTVKYVDEEGTSIKESVIRNALVNSTPDLFSSDKESIYANDKKYIYKSDNASTTTIAESGTEVTIVFREAETWSYTVNATDGTNIIAQLASGSGFEQDAVRISYPKYFNVEGTLYTKNANSSDYRQNVTISEDNQVTSFVYSSTDISNIVYFSEAENVEGATATSAGSNMTNRSSNSMCGYAKEDITLINLPVGIYKANMVCYSNSSAGHTSKFKFDKDYNATVSGASNWTTFEYEFTLTEATDIKWLTSGDSKNGLDYIYIQKTGDYDPTDVTSLITNNSFETGDLTGWTASRTDGDTGVKANSNATYHIDNADGDYLFNTWNGDATGYDITQTLEALPAGYYKLEALFAGRIGSTVQLVANDNTTTVTHTATGTATKVGVTFALGEATNVTIGAKNATGWYKVDNFTLHTMTAAEYLAPLVAEYEATLEAAQAIANMTSGISTAAKSIVSTAITTYGSVDSENPSDYTAATAALKAAMAEAQTSIDTYNLIATGTIPTDAVAGWTKTTTNGTVACNTWSTEGNSDGSSMTTPFIQDWVGSGTALGEGTLSYTLAGLEPGEKYNISALVRVFNEAAGSLDGASFFANDKSVDIDAEGNACTGDYATKGIYGIFNAKAVEVDNEGKITLGIAIADGSALNWVAIKNVTISEFADQKVESITLSQTSATLTTGDALTLTATIAPETADDKTFTWSSNNEAVATVSAVGIVSALAAGNATITATANDGSGVTATCAITVADAPAIANATAISGTGQYLLRNVATGKYLGQGNSYGTQVSINDHAVWVTATKADDGTYKLTGICGNNGLGSNGYVDNGTPVALTVTPVDGKTNVYTLSPAASNYVAAQAGTTVVTMAGANAASTLAQWQFIAEAEANKNLTSATAETPADVTYMIKDANFSRNVDSSVWTMDASNKNLSGGAQTNQCAESYHATFTLSQVLTVPNGTYKMRAQAVANSNATGAVVYANAEEAAFNVMAHGENSMTNCSDQFSAGNYYTDWVTVTVTDHKLTVGVKGGNDSSWCVWDNFELYMTGYVPVTAIAATIDKTEFEAGQTATISDIAVTPVAASFTAYSFSSSDENVATVSADGVVTGVAAGTATITIAAEMENVTKTFDITVKAPAVVPTSITLAVNDEAVEALTLFISKTATIAATVNPDGANQAVSFASDNEAVVTVSDEGVLTPVKYGTANITVTSLAKAEVTAVLPVTVTAPLITEAENLDFAQGPVIDNHICTYATDMSKNNTTYSRTQPLTGWTNLSTDTDGKAAGVMQYGSSTGMGNNSTFAPATNPNGEASGNVFGMVGVWTGSLQYVQSVKLPAGAYTITIPVYRNEGATAISKNMIGVVMDDGTEHFATTTVYTANSWTTEKISFVVDEESYGKLSLGLSAPNKGSADSQRLWIDGITVTFEPFATSDDYAALNTAIAAKDNKTLGFKKDEYAPYNNVAVLEVLASAKAINQEANNAQSVVQAATAALEAAEWGSANTEEVNAFFDGSFEHDYSGQTGNVQPLGWYRNEGTYSGDGYNVRYVIIPSGVEGNTSGHGLFGKFTMMYGKQTGYSLPLKAGVYSISFMYGGYGETGSRIIKVYSGNTQATVLPTTTITAKNNQANTKADAYSKFEGKIVVPADGDYVFSFYRENTSSQNQIAIVDIKMFSVPESSATLAVTAAKYGTFMAPFDVTMPEGVIAYTVSDDGGSQLTLTSKATAGSVLPANTPVVVHSENVVSETVQGYSLATKDSYQDGALVGTYVDIYAPDGSYILQNQNGKVGFYRVDTSAAQPMVRAGRAYLTATGNARASFFFDDAVVGIDAIEALTSGEALIYDVNGVRQPRLVKGLNIIRTKDGRTQKIMVR